MANDLKSLYNSRTDTTGITSRVQAQLVDSPYQLATPFVIASTGPANLFLTGAAYAGFTETILFSANAQSATTTTSLIDTNQFLSQGVDIGSLDLSLFWNNAFTIPTGFTYNISRDGGINYFPVTMSQVGATGAFYGNIRFGTSTTTETTQTGLNVVAGTATSLYNVATTDDIWNISPTGATSAIGFSFVPSGSPQTLGSFTGFLKVTSGAFTAGTIGLRVLADSGSNHPGATVLATAQNTIAASAITTTATAFTWVFNNESWASSASRIWLFFYWETPPVGSTTNVFWNSKDTGSTDPLFYGNAPIGAPSGVVWNGAATTNTSIEGTLTSGTTSFTDLNITTQQKIAQSFTVPANTNWVTTNLALSVTKVGTPTGNLYASLTTTSSGAPGTVLAQSNAVNIANLTTGAVTIALPSTVLTGGPSGTQYFFVLSTDATYQSVFTGSNKIQLGVNTSGSGEQLYNGTTWSTTASAVSSSLQGRIQDIRVQVVSAGSPTYPCHLDGFAVFYNLQDIGVVGAVKKTQRFVFNSVTDNLSTFTITAFSPDVDLLSIFHTETGQVYKAGDGSFSLAGNVVTFPANTFNNGNVSTTVTLIADQNSGATVDNSDSNARLLATNHLGSTSGIDDRSVAGRGIILRRPDGTLREITLDNSDNIVILSVP